MLKETTQDQSAGLFGISSVFVFEAGSYHVAQASLEFIFLPQLLWC